jgi:hypothetical protein
MKKKILLIITGLIICTAFNKSKIADPSRTIKTVCTDYRDAYVGYYFCHSFSTTGGSENPYRIKDTLTINVAKNVLDSIIQITVGPNTLKYKLTSGVLRAYPDGHRGGKFFATDSISVNISYGHVSASYFIGKKL